MSHSHESSLSLGVTLERAQLDELARRVADLLHEGRDDGFLDTDAAADYLGLSRKAIYALVERRRLPYYRPAGRLLFERAELRAWGALIRFACKLHD